MLKVTEVLKTITEYEAQIKTVAFPFAIEINLNTNKEAIAFLNELTKKASGNNIDITDYTVLQQYSMSLNQLQFVKTLPIWNYEKLEDIVKWHKKTFRIPEIDKPVIFFYRDIRAIYTKWKSQSNFLKVPDEFKSKHYYENKIYYDQIKTLPPENQAAAYKAVAMISNPESLFETAKKYANNGLVRLIELFREKHSNKGELIDNVYIDIRHDIDIKSKLGKEMYMGLLNIDYWLKNGFDEKFLLDQKGFDKALKDIFERYKETEKEKAKSKTKSDEEELAKQRENAAKLKESIKNDPEFEFDKKKRADREEYLKKAAEESGALAYEAKAAIEAQNLIKGTTLSNKNELMHAIDQTKNAIEEAESSLSTEDKILELSGGPNL